MSKQQFSEMSTDALLKNQKNLKVITYMLGGALIVLFVANVFLAFKKGFSALNVVPIALLPILIINLNSLKAMEKEIKSRNI